MPTTFSFTPSKPSPIRPPVCAKCSTQMLLVELDSDVFGAEIHTFECVKCQHREGRITKVQKRDLGSKAFSATDTEQKHLPRREG